MTVPYGIIAAGAPSSVANMAKHLLNNTLAPEHLLLASRYQNDIVPNIDNYFNDLAQQVANGTTSHGEAENSLILREFRSSQYKDESRLIFMERGLDAEMEFYYAMHERVAARLLTAVERIEQGLEHAPLAILRQDVHPLAVHGLGLDPTQFVLSEDQIAGLMAGRRADGALIGGKHYAVERNYAPNPRTGERKVTHPVGSIDFVPAPHKSVSLAWAFASPGEQAMILAAWVQASREGMAYVADEIGRAGIGKHGAKGEEKGHVAWVEFLHHTTRKVAVSMQNGEIQIDPRS